MFVVVVVIVVNVVVAVVAAVVGCLKVCPALDEVANTLKVPVACGQDERGGPVDVGGLHIDLAVLDEKANTIAVSACSGQSEWAAFATLALCRVGRRNTRDQHTHNRKVAVLTRTQQGSLDL